MIGLLFAMMQMLGSSQPKPGVPVYFPPSLIVPSIPCPAGALRSDGVVSEFKKGWYARQLAAANEPPLFGAPKNESLRFTWLRTFHKPIIVRLVGLQSPTPRLIAKELTGRGGYDPGTIGRTVSRVLTREEAGAIRTLVARTRVVTQPVDGCRMGTDGAEWLIESNDRAGYHFIDEWSPEKGAVRETGLALIKLTGWTIDPVY